MSERYQMSEKTLVLWTDHSGKNTYKGFPIEIDNSIPYGAVEHIDE